MADVLVVGAGPTGLMAATLLARSGISAAIIDKNAEPATESRAFATHARSLEIFAKLGLEQRFLEKGTVMEGAEVFLDGQPVARISFQDLPRSDTPFPFVLLIPQAQIELLLLDDLRSHGVEVNRPCELTHLEQDEHHATARFSNGESATFRYVIGADGAHSLVRKAAGLTFEGAPYADTFLLADCKVGGADTENRARFYLHGKQFALQFPLAGTEGSRIYAVAEGADAEPTLDNVQQIVRKCSGLDLTLSNATWVSRYRVHHRSVDRYRAGRFFVAGDAAHIHSPAGGQGMNTGLQDAANLAWKLALVLNGQAPPALLDTYHQERWPVGQRVVQVTDRLFRVVLGENPLVAKLRDRLMPMLARPLSSLQAVRSTGFHYLSQLGIRYRPNFFVDDDGGASSGPSPVPLSGSAASNLLPQMHSESLPGSNRATIGRPNAPRAGHRAPNALIQRNLDVFALISGYQFDLLVLSRSALKPAQIEHLQAQLDATRRTAPFPLRTHLVAPCLNGRHPGVTQIETTDLYRTYQLTENRPHALVLIRPDGHIAFRSDSHNLDALHRFVARFQAHRGEASPSAKSK